MRVVVPTLAICYYQDSASTSSPTAHPHKIIMFYIHQCLYIFFSMDEDTHNMLIRLQLAHTQVQHDQALVYIVRRRRGGEVMLGPTMVRHEEKSSV